ncbi:MAG: SDR family oxidoreductase [Gammaproteobacteria bacterium]|nr:SDR family oxidoreductase [Gammaproteobacteria bacterium]MBU1446732.1 SDR family oxidoreductase [Gammaproteobacteria bacterium]
MNDFRMLVTGANGFVGSAMCHAAVARGFRVRGATRKGAQLESGIENIAVGDIGGCTDWREALRDIDVVIHLAARVHVMRETLADPLAAFRAVNVAGTENLARQAAEAGVKRLVYVSSIKVNGEETTDGRIYRASDMPAPQDPYGISKWEAEQALHRVAAETGLEVVIVRPPLVFGPGVKGNFAQMMKALQQGFPLPLASVQNKRSLVYVGNLVDALITCATHPAAAGQTYLIGDGADLSTPELLRQLGSALGCTVHLFACPCWLLRVTAGIAGRSQQMHRLLGSLQVDSARIRRELGWHPPYTLQQGLQETAEWYRNHA